MGLVIGMCGSLKQILVGLNCGIRLLGEVYGMRDVLSLKLTTASL